MNRETSLAIAYAVIALSGGAIEQSIPDTARWIAQDRDGLWWWYEQKPRVDIARYSCWFPPAKGAKIDDTHGKLGKGISPADFTQALYKIGGA